MFIVIARRVHVLICIQIINCSPYVIVTSLYWQSGESVNWKIRTKITIMGVNNRQPIRWCRSALRPNYRIGWQSPIDPPELNSFAFDESFATFLYSKTIRFFVQTFLSAFPSSDISLRGPMSSCLSTLRTFWITSALVENFIILRSFRWLKQGRNYFNVVARFTQGIS